MKSLLKTGEAWLILILTLIAVLLLVNHIANAQWEEKPQGTQLDVGGLLNEKASSYTAQATHATKHGWIGLQASEIRADGEIKSQDLDARIQGGFEITGVSAQFFIEANRNMRTDYATSTGAYLRKSLKFDKFNVIIGGGTFVEREDIREELGLTTEPTVLPYLLAIAHTGYNLTENIGVTAHIVAKPEARFQKAKGTATLGADIRVADNAVLKFQSTNDFTIDNGLETDTENSLLLSLSF